LRYAPDMRSIACMATADPRISEIVALARGMPFEERKALARLIAKATPEEARAAKQKAVNERWAAVREKAWAEVQRKTGAAGA
jgi:hypothetical protein